MKTYNITITLQMEIDPDEVDIEVAVDDFFDNPAEFEYSLDCVEVDPTTYKIIRFYQDDTPSEVIERGLTLAEAQAHCQRDDTHGDGWFDGYDEDND